MTAPRSALSIRLATIHDSGILCELGSRTFYDTFAADNTPENMQLYLSQTFNRQRVEDELKDPGSGFYMASIDDKIAGYSKLKYNSVLPGKEELKSLEIERLYVLAEFQKQKIGVAFMEHSIAEAQKQGCGLIWLGVWEHNHKARKFYESRGFDYAGSHDFMLGHDRQLDLLMVKHLK